MRISKSAGAAGMAWSHTFIALLAAIVSGAGPVRADAPPARQAGHPVNDPALC